MSYKEIISDYLKDKTSDFKKQWLEQMKTTCDQWAKNKLLVDSADEEIKYAIEELIENEN